MADLTISPETVCYLIAKAREFDVKVEPADPDSGSNPADDKEIDILEDLIDDPTFEEVSSALSALNDDETLDPDVDPEERTSCNSSTDFEYDRVLK